MINNINSEFLNKDLDKIVMSANSSTEACNSNKNLDKYKDKSSNISDSIKISASPEMINAKKAKEIFKKTVSQFNGVNFYGWGDMTGPLGLIEAYMEAEGKFTSIYSLGNLKTSNFSFINHINDIITTTKEHLDKVPSNFLDFCNTLKKNLEEKGCK